jgi:hypothetical protein
LINPAGGTADVVIAVTTINVTKNRPINNTPKKTFFNIIFNPLKFYRLTLNPKESGKMCIQVKRLILVNPPQLTVGFSYT